MKRFVFVLALLLTVPACHAPVTITTPQGQAAYTADQIGQRVNELENSAISAQGNGSLDLATAKLIVNFCVSADKTLAQAPAGWQAIVGKAWSELKTKLPPQSNPLVQTAISAVDAALAAVGS